MRGKLEAHFRRILASEAGTEQDKLARLAWRLSCFDAGLSYADYVRENFFTIEGKQVFDVACAWGGHALAFASRGARVLASDYNDHRFDALREFAAENDLHLRPARADCQSLPVADQTMDVVLALELVEHIASVEPFAKEVARVLRPGGLCILSTPPRLRSVYEGEPHWGLKGLTILPFSTQKLAATKVFRRTYPYPITRQYTTASSVIRPFARHGLSGAPILRGQLARRLASHARLLHVAQDFLWNFIVLTKTEKGLTP
jgi:2-polyprenyl-3-methyl-5-hydroxy-6-metoxy-1,4-benzoquinol methylase